MICEITILSGKGGTGKTSVTAALAQIAGNAVFSDCDVDASDLHLLLTPEIKEEHEFAGGRKAWINPAKCISCGICQDACRFDAIHKINGHAFYVNPFQCEGCRLCERICPASAITSSEPMNNRWFVSETRFGTMVHARMAPGEENSGKLVTAVREKARELAEDSGYDYIINDGPPGIGCPVIASLTGVNKVLMVIEPTKSGLHDMERLSELTRKFGIRTYALINKADLHPGLTASVSNRLKELEISCLGEIPFDENFVKAMVSGQTILEYVPDSASSLIIREAWNALVMDVN